MLGSIHCCLALLFVLSLRLGLTTANCIPPRRVRFKPLDAAGDVSYLTDAFVSEVVLDPQNVGATHSFVPSVIVELQYFDNATSEWVTDTTPSSDGVAVFAEVWPPGISDLIGGVAQLSVGWARFDSLHIVDFFNSTVAPSLRFSLTLPITGETLSVRSGPVRYLNADSKTASIRFRSAGYFNRPGVSRTIPVGVALPTSWIELCDIFGNLHSDTVALTVHATVGTVSPSYISVSSQQYIELPNLKFFPDPAQPASPTVIAFVLRPGVNISTGVLMPAIRYQRNRFLGFDPQLSSVQYENQASSAVIGMPMAPIVVNLYTSAYGQDLSLTGLLIRGTCAEAELDGAEVITFNGVATFNRLIFKSTPRSAMIIFTASPLDPSIAVAGESIHTGSISVSSSPVKGQYLSFAPSSFLQAGVAQTIILQNQIFTIPSIIVQMLDSARQIDTSTNGNQLLLLPSDSSVQPRSSDALTFKVMQNGVVAWTNVDFIGKDGSQIQFHIVDANNNNAGGGGGGAASGQLGSGSLYSGVLSIRSDPISTAQQRLVAFGQCLYSNMTGACLFSTKFGDSSRSAISEEGQELFATVGFPVPEIRISLLDLFGQSRDMPQGSVPMMVAFSGDSPSTEQYLVLDQNSNVARWMANEYVFSCLQFSQQPQGLVQLTFRVVDTVTGAKYSAIPDLVTGPITVVGSRQSNFGLRFANVGSLLSFPGQRSSAVLNVALPPIVVEIVDSTYAADPSSNTIVIAATTSSGALDPNGARVTVVNGQATFTTLKFLSIADAAVVSFTAVLTSEPVAGRAVQTGAITVSTLPLSAYELAFLTTADDPTTNVTRQFQPFVFQTFNDAKAHMLRAVLVLQNSGHQQELQAASGTAIKIEASSDEAQLFGTTLASIDANSPNCPCANFSTGILTYVPNQGFEGGPIYIKYTVTASTVPTLIGASLIAGPIVIVQQPGVPDTCATNVAAPRIVAEFAISPDAFLSRATTVQTQLANMMSVEQSRVTLANLRQYSRRDPATASRVWVLKVDVAFADPFPASVNRMTSAELAAQFVALRSSCDTTVPGMLATYYRQYEQLCDVGALALALNASQQCAVELVTPTCECYARGVLGSWGSSCRDTADAQGALISACTATAACRDAVIMDTCEVVLAELPNPLNPLWGTLGGLAGLALIVGFLRYKRLLCFRLPITLKREQIIVH